jgi:ribonuclease HII
MISPMPTPTFSRESELIAQGFTVCGVDEAGRGPWAGPVVAAAVILDPGNIPAGLNDSKKLTEAKREALFTSDHAGGQRGRGHHQRRAH